MLQVCAKDGPPLPLVRSITVAHRPHVSCLGPLQPWGLNLSVSVRPQGEQLRGLLQLQVLHPLPGLLTGVLSVHRSHRAAVLHQILDSECCVSPLRVVDGGAEDADWAPGRSPALHPLVWSCMALTSPLFFTDSLSSLLLTLQPLCFPSLLSPPALSHSVFVLWDPPPLPRHQEHRSRQSWNPRTLPVFFFVFLLLLSDFILQIFTFVCLCSSQAIFIYSSSQLPCFDWLVLLILICFLPFNLFSPGVANRSRFCLN